MIVDVFEMVLVVIGAVLTAVLVWLLMRKYDRDHKVAVCAEANVDSNISPASPTAMPPASPTPTPSPTSTTSPEEKRDAVVAYDNTAGDTLGGHPARQDTKDAPKSQPLAAPLGEQEATQISPPSGVQPQPSTSDKALATETAMENISVDPNIAKERSGRDQRKPKQRKSTGVISATVGNASTLKAKHSKHKLSKAAPSGAEVVGETIASATQPVALGSDGTVPSTVGSPQAVRGGDKDEVAERLLQAPHTESDLPKISSSEQPSADVCRPSSLARKPESKRKQSKLSKSSAAASAAMTKGVVDSSHVASSLPAGAEVPGSGTGIGLPTAFDPSSQTKPRDGDDPNLQELRALHMRRASRISSTAFPAQRRKSQVAAAMDIFSAETSGLDAGEDKAPTDK